MISQGKSLLTASVCAGHFFLVSLFLSTGSDVGTANVKSPSVSVQLLHRPRALEIVQNAAKQPSIHPAAIAPASNPQRFEQPAADRQINQEKSDTLIPPALNPSRFLDLDAIDQAAISPAEFDSTLTDALPVRFDPLVLEILIDEVGNVVRVSCIEGGCDDVPIEKLHALLAILFKPAIKDGRDVASRKVIEISPIPTFGL